MMNVHEDVDGEAMQWMIFVPGGTEFRVAKPDSG
jgi:hypothetical protein